MSALSFAQIAPQPLSWLWHNYLPRGRLTLLAADPGAGKTSLALHLASQLSQALPLPGNSGLSPDSVRLEKCAQFQEKC
ncbi:MAG TPA: AAA family ATPase [Phycisphaerae bacterium]|nr:AAA family ATPase [Phycisphaerae bacterium]